jgi:hypothetical protein
MPDTNTRSEMRRTQRDTGASAREAAHAAADSATGAARDAAEQADEVFQHTAEDAHDIGMRMTDTVVRTADAAADMAQRVAEQQREVMWLGVRAAAGRLADVGYGRGHRVLGQAVRSLEIYGQAAATTAETMQSLFASWMTLARGMQETQHAYFSLLDRATQNGGRKPQDILRCKSLEEVAEVQRDLYLDAVNQALDSTTTLLQLAGRVTQDAMRPLAGRSQPARA